MPISNPYIDALDALPDGSKKALALAHLTATAVPQGQPMQGLGGSDGPIIPPAPRAQSGQTQQPLGVIPPLPQSHASQIQAPQRSAPQAANMGEMNRLESSPSGVGGLKHAGLRIPLQILDAIGGGLIPGIEQRLPGTEGHHELLVRQSRNRVTGDETMLNDQAKRTLETEQAINTADLPGSRELTAENAANKTKSAEEIAGLKTNAQRDIADARLQGQQATAAQVAADRAAARKAQLHQHGYDEDENGNIIPVAEENLSAPARAELEDKRSLQAARQAASELSAARQELVRAQAANVPAQLALAQQRLKSAEASHSIALERLHLSEQQTEARLHGTQGGEALPGAMLTGGNTPVGSAFQQNVRPTASERGKADLANSAEEQVNDIKAIVKKRPDIFGPAAGRKTSFETWIGSEDPEAKAFATARTIAADHLAGVFGGRSETALAALDNAIGQYKDNPAAIERSLEQVLKGNQSFQKAGTVRTAGSTPKAGTGTMIRARDPKGKLHEAPVGSPLPPGWKAEPGAR